MEIIGDLEYNAVFVVYLRLKGLTPLNLPIKIYFLPYLTLGANIRFLILSIIFFIVSFYC
jgi:hypothetical protein